METQTNELQHAVNGGQVATQHSTSTNDLIFDPNAMGQMMAIAECMSSGVSTIPRHLQGNTSDCMAVVMQAAQWRMNPYSVAQKTHVVNGNLGYEAQLVNAVVSSSTKIEGSFFYEWFGPWEKVIGKFKTIPGKNGGKPYQAPDWSPADEKGCGIRVAATLRGEGSPRTLELLLSQAQVRNSTLWASDPKQQLAYLGVKRWARLYAPDVILGVYTPDEYEQEPVQRERNINEAPKSSTGSAAMDKAVNSAQELTKAASDLVREINNAATLNTLKGVYEKIKAAAQGGAINDYDRKTLKLAFDEAYVNLEAIEAAEAAMNEEDQ
jgi:hypothetical protein